MKVKSKKEIFFSKILNKTWKHLPSFVQTRYSFVIFNLNSIVNGKRNKNYLLSGNKLEFVHIPKTAGSSIKTAFRNINLLEESDEVHRPMSSKYDPSMINYFTCLREPLSRVYSLYVMGLRSGPEYPMYREAMSGLKYFVKSSSMYFECSNLQSRYCSLSPYKNEPNPIEVVDVLKSFKGVFIFEKLESDFDYLQMHLPHKNKNSYPKKMNTEDMKFIRSLNKTDQTVYDHFFKLTSEQRLKKLKLFMSKFYP